MTIRKKILTVLGWFFGNLIYFLNFLVPKKKNLWVFGAWFGGLLAQNRIKAGWTVNRTRKFVIALGGVIMLISLLLTMKAATPTARLRRLGRRTGSGSTLPPKRAPILAC